MSKLCIVAIGYNRADSLHRLLDSIEKADYENDECTLIISLDNSGSSDVYQMANSFKWSHGEKRVILQEKRLGLKKHILKCGDYLDEFDAGAILEDDIVVSPAYYGFMKQAVEFYKNETNIAGISLYTHLRNPEAKYPFEPQKTNYDTYFIQYAQSWGQIWIRDRWKEFKAWLSDNSASFNSAKKVPQNVCEWSEKSWLKYHIRYCIDMNRYFVYPYYAYSTCFSEVGEHCLLKQNALQVPMLLENGRTYSFAPFADRTGAVFYDAYFERENLKIPGADETSAVTIDLYGKKNLADYNARYVLSSQPLNYKVVKSFAREMRPQEVNILCEVPGKDFFLYDTGTVEKNSQKKDEVNEYIYYHKVLGHTKVVRKLLSEMVKEKLILTYHGIIRK